MGRDGSMEYDCVIAVWGTLMETVDKNAEMGAGELVSMYGGDRIRAPMRKRIDRDRGGDDCMLTALHKWPACRKR